MQIHSYLEERIRRAPPAGRYIVPGSTPVVAFGAPRHGRIATLGLNPSRVEFLDRSGRELAEPARRLETLRSLGISDLSHAPDSIIDQVIAGCDAYFQRNPYWRWFRPLEWLLAGVGASYANGSACHLDLVQWATDPTWGALTPTVRRELIAEDAAFLRQQLAHEPVETLLLNGQSVIDGFVSHTQTPLRYAGQIGDRGLTARLVAGYAHHGIAVVGWSTNLQSSYGVTSIFRERLRDAAAALIAELRHAGGAAYAVPRTADERSNAL